MRAARVAAAVLSAFFLAAASLSLTVQYLVEHGVAIQGTIDPYGMKYLLIAVVLLGLAVSCKSRG